jgi:hypothetical protein
LVNKQIYLNGMTTIEDRNQEMEQEKEKKESMMNMSEFYWNSLIQILEEVDQIQVIKIINTRMFFETQSTMLLK